MRMLSGKSGAFAAAALLIAGAIVWSRNLAPNTRVNEASVRDIAGVELDVGEPNVSPEGTSVTIRMENRTQRTAASVVFTIEVTDDAGQTLMANPLGNALNLQPGESRTMDVPIPMPADTDRAAAKSARGRVNLVRWGD